MEAEAALEPVIERSVVIAGDPKRNADYWVLKLQANVERDRRIDQSLGDHGWTVVHVWEHEEPQVAADRVERTVRAVNS